jgi:predicted nucleic acid-binding Zn ribbon protein
MKLTKICIVCGKEFETRQSNYTICSDECRTIRRKNYHNIVSLKYYHQNKERINRRGQSLRLKNSKPILCKICGKNVEPYFSGDRICRKRYHEECIIEESIKAMNKGEKFNKTSKILRVANNQGITKSELLEIIKERELEVEQ